MKDYYSVLGVTETSTQDEIKKSYRKLSKQYHPDVNPDGDEKFKEIAEAYENIGDEKKRKDYDFKRKNPFANMGGGFDINSMFDQMVNMNKPKRGPDKVIPLDITVIESYFGVKKELDLNIAKKCQPCDGAGGEKRICETCKGHGVVVQVFGTGMFKQQIQTNCPTCNGYGSVLINACQKCSGMGVNRTNEKIQVSIPPNVDNGDFLRLSNKGDYHPPVKNNGDIILKVNLLNDNKYQKMGIDLIYTKMMGPLSLMLDKTFFVDHPDGELSINTPTVINTEKPLRIVNKGFKTNEGNGNFYIKVVIEKNIDLNDEVKQKIKNILK
jgi:molecular chaperone DnaJ